METKDNAADASGVDFFIDITADVCPITFVRTKLLIERMASGQTAEIRLRGAEPLANLPRAVALQGHVVIALEAETPAFGWRSPEPPGPNDAHRLRLRKA
ncbi:MAG: sulfurtransferase TusA family protein [Rhodospirillales bacterium]|nr:sulfurtransferase TusA family protein [Rhodospirillales bacterium]